MKPENCPFCNFETRDMVCQSSLVVGLWNSCPVSPGHALLVTRRHVASWFDASQEEQRELLAAITRIQQEIEKLYKPDDYTIRFNVGMPAGQSGSHLHLHVIPRYGRDVLDTVSRTDLGIPEEIESSRPRKGSGIAQWLPHDRALVEGDEDPLLPHLLALMDRAVAVDIVVSFVMESGVRKIIEHLRDLMERGGRLRFLTGDYLDVTDPGALELLLDLEGDRELRVYESKQTSFHPKTYIFHAADGSGVAYVGSSNLSAMAMEHGIEWNYRVLSSWDTAGFDTIVSAFGKLMQDPSARELTQSWISDYAGRRSPVPTRTIEFQPEPPSPPPEPHEIQREALRALDATRKKGNRAGLVVLATGLGKTWLAAFDSGRAEFSRILFVAHRDEILNQAIATFRRIRPLASLGKFTGMERSSNAEIMFASIQTLGKLKTLKQFAPESFNYIIIDEFHHASARTYRNLIDHFKPGFLLGLTATPERTDGGNLLALCEGNLVYRCDVAEGIRKGLLSGFDYFGVPDEVDYENIPWRSNRFSEEELTAAVATETRARNALEQYRGKAGGKTLGFCCSRIHADFMAQFFRSEGIRCASVHSGETSDPRASSLEMLAKGELEVIFSVDMFNEGVDLPEIDTVMMLRPTESRTVWLQQFGRGLRKKTGNRNLTVIDYIGNHRNFLLKPKTLLGLGAGDAALYYALERVQLGTQELPPGCSVTYDLAAIDIMKKLLRVGDDLESFKWYYTDFREREGQRPSAVVAYCDGYSPLSVRPAFDSWTGFIKEMGDLPDAWQEVYTDCSDFFRLLETTAMSRSYKMAVLQAMLARNAFPLGIGIEDLVDEIGTMIHRSAAIAADFSVAVDDRPGLRALIIKNPLHYLSRSSPFSFKNGIFRCTHEGVLRHAGDECLSMIVREITEWRLTSYLARNLKAQVQD